MVFDLTETCVCVRGNQSSRLFLMGGIKSRKDTSTEGELVGFSEEEDDEEDDDDDETFGQQPSFS